jgi:hypothetical protein
MAEREPKLPMYLPIRLPKRSFGQRVKAMFTQPVKLPGWLLVVITLVQVVPDWKSRFDFWLDVAKSTGGYLAVAATVIASPYFTPSLLAVGLGWIVFAGEAPVGVQRHHWLKHVGWAVSSFCVAVIVVTIGYGAIEFYIQKEVSTRDTEIQQQAAVRPVFWHLTDAQKTALGAELDKIPEDQRFQIPMKCLPDAGSRTFVEEIGQIFIDHKWKVSANCFFTNVRPDLTGLWISVPKSLSGKKIEDTPKNIQTLAKILNGANIAWRFAIDQISDNEFYLVIGNAP